MRDATPGPWYAERAGASGRRQVCDLVDGRLTWWRIVHDGEADGDAEADAKIIAAGPSLLSALRNLVGLARVAGPRLGQYEAAIAAADAAIEQAEGGS